MLSASEIPLTQSINKSYRQQRLVATLNDGSLWLCAHSFLTANGRAIPDLLLPSVVWAKSPAIEKHGCYVHISTIHFLSSLKFYWAGTR